MIKLIQEKLKLIKLSYAKLNEIRLKLTMAKLNQVKLTMG